MKRTSFIVSQDGAVTLMVALAMILLIGSAGAAIDMARAQLVEMRMQNALDAAGLAVGSESSTANLSAEESKYFYTNFPAHYLGTTVESLTIQANPSNSVLTLNVSGTVPTTFMQILGIDSVPVGAKSQITKQSKGLELVLVMDNTGSMAQSAGGGVSKIQAAKSAATTLLNIIYGGRSTVPNLWVGLVPFSQAVNIGSVPNVSSWLDSTYDATLNWGTSKWYGCVEARTNGSFSPQYDITDDPPSVKKFRQYYSPCDTNTTVPNAWYGTNSSKDNCKTTGGTVKYLATSPTTIGPNLYCPQSVQPMVAEESTVLSAINNMQPNGNTHISLGLAWGWRMLSPRWRGLWGGEMNSNNLPLDYNQPLMNKVVILMTDGDNTLTGSNAASNGANIPGAYSAYGIPNQNWLAVSGSECNSSWNCTNGQTKLNDRTLGACTAMKAQGIIIYTIALGSQVSATGQSMLQSCATNSSYYFLSPTTNELQGIFQQIGDSLANLFVSQ